MNRKADNNVNLYGDSIDSSEEKSVSMQELQPIANNLTITIPKFENNVFLKYDYVDLLHTNLDKLIFPYEDNLFTENFFKEKAFAEDNFLHSNQKFLKKKPIFYFKSLKNFVKTQVNFIETQDGAVNTFLRSKFIEDEINNIEQEKISSDDVKYT